MQQALQNIAAHIRGNDGFTIIAHVSPDGDTLGSSLALWHTLRRMGKKAQVVCEDPVPYRYAFLPGVDDIIKPVTAQIYANAIAVDCADRGRMGKGVRLFDAALHSICIDHHVTNLGFAQLSAVDGHAAATGELMYSLVLELLKAFDAPIASCLYVAILTDTGGFAYSNTTPATYRICGALVEAGADNVEIDRRINRSHLFGEKKLLGLVLSKMSLHHGGMICISSVSREDMALCGFTSADSEGIVEHIRDIAGVEAAALVRETPMSGGCKISLRSKYLIDVSEIAAQMGGGGHAHAAGYSDADRLDVACARALSLLERALDGKA